MSDARPWWGISLASCIGATACVNGTLPQRGPQHPANPAAPEGYASLELASIAERAKPDSGVPSDAPTAATLYVCPMHPEVISNSPGTCPKCGMKLVPKVNPPKPGVPAVP